MTTSEPHGAARLQTEFRTSVGGRRRANPWFALLWPVILFCLLGLAVLNGHHPPEILFGIAALSVVTLVFYGWDKLAAMRNRPRVGEKTLHLLAVAGGWPGAMLAQQLFNHKTSKAAFRRVFWLTVLLNCAVIGTTFTEEEGGMLRGVIGQAHGLTERITELLPGR